MNLITKSVAKFSSKKLFIGANWKSNNTKLQTEELLSKVFNKLKYDPKKVDVILAPAFVHLHVARLQLENKNIALAAQNCSAYSFGAYTGEIRYTNFYVAQNILKILVLTGSFWDIPKGGHTSKNLQFSSQKRFELPSETT